LPNGGSDCCGTCPFNGVNKGKVQYPPDDIRMTAKYFCEIRNFEIDVPFWTYCNNHPRRNPLWSKTPRGPVWTAVYQSYDSKSFNKNLKILAEFLPPVGDGMYARIPYYKMTRPNLDHAAECHICGEKCEDTISIDPPDEDKKFFCSVSHYYEWWLSNSPLIKEYQQKELKIDDFKAKLLNIGEFLSSSIETYRSRENEGKKELLKYLQQLDDLIRQTPYAVYDIVHIEIFLNDPELQKKFSSFMLQLKTYLSEIGILLRRDPKNKEAIIDMIQKIHRIILEESK
jgi:hypothetical protein